MNAMIKTPHAFAFIYFEQIKLLKEVQLLIETTQEIFQLEKVYVSLTTHDGDVGRTYKYSEERLAELLESPDASEISVYDTNKEDFDFELNIGLDLSPTIDASSQPPQCINVVSSCPDESLVLKRLTSFADLCAQHVTILHGGAGLMPDYYMASSEVTMITSSSKQSKEFIERVQSQSREDYLLWKQTRGLYPITILSPKLSPTVEGMNVVSKTSIKDASLYQLSDDLGYYSDEFQALLK